MKIRRIKIIRLLVLLLSNLLFWVMLVMSLGLFVGKLWGIQPYIVMSGSMEPAISTGGISFVDTRAKYDQIEEGDIIAYKTGSGSLVTHRVISKTEEGLITKGDANRVADDFSVTKREFVGKNIFSVPYGGYLLMYLQQPGNLLLCAALLLGISLLKNTIGHKTEMFDVP